MKLLPYNYKKYSGILIFGGGMLLYNYFQGIKPVWLQVPVFAIASTYLESRYMQMVETNLMDELGFILSILGLFILVFTKEKLEVNENLSLLRLDSFLTATFITFLIWIILYLFIFVYSIFFISILIFPFYLMIYYVIFRIKISKLC